MRLLWDLKSFTGWKYSLLANIAGTGWAAVVQLACIPLYVKFLGIEGFGLVGFYLMVQSLLQVMDLGLSPTINREMARYSVQPQRAEEARSLVRTLEAGYWMIGITLGGIIAATAPLIATYWIKSSNMPVSKVAQAVMLMGVLAVFQWPISFYQGALMGLDRQVVFNALKVAMVTLSNFGAVLVLWRVTPTIKAFLLWQILIAAAQALLIMLLLWSSLPNCERPAQFNPSILRGVWRFAAGMSGITLIGLILTQVDKLLVSKLLTLKVFGYYSLAWSVSNGLLIISGAVFNVVFPRMSAQVIATDEVGMRDSYHRGAQLMAVVVLPIAAVLTFFSYDVLQTWTRSAETASFDARILSVLVIGSCLNSLLYLPYALQLAFGWTRINLIAGIISIMIVIPALFPMTKHFGALGAASLWAALNILTMMIVVPITHRRLLRGETWRYFRDIGYPFVCTMGVAMIGRLAFPGLVSRLWTVVCIFTVWLGAFIGAVLAAPRIRAWTFAQVTNVRFRLMSHGSIS